MRLYYWRLFRNYYFLPVWNGVLDYLIETLSEFRINHKGGMLPFHENGRPFTYGEMKIVVKRMKEKGYV